MKRTIFLAFLQFAAVSLLVAFQGSETTIRSLDAARTWLETLSPAQRERAVEDFKGRGRSDWAYTPRSRGGIRLDEMSKRQKQWALALVGTGLSDAGFERAKGILWLDGYLARERGSRNRFFGQGAYHLTLYDQPSLARPWGWRIEGHHLSLNFTLKGDKVLSPFPLFMGSEPAVVPGGAQKGRQVLREEQDWGRELFLSFNGAARSQALLSDVAPRDIITRNSSVAGIGEPKGIAFPAMSPAQQKKLMALVELYAHRLRKDLAEAELSKIRRAGIENIRFAWAGSTTPREGHYYRIHGPTFLIEYDNTQNNANHIHTVWRDLKNDFGRDLLKEHYATAFHHRRKPVP